MPQATAELQEEFGTDDYPIMVFLEIRGYQLTNKYTWVRHPNRRRSTAKELRAIQFLIQEYDFGGLEE